MRIIPEHYVKWPDGQLPHAHISLLPVAGLTAICPANTDGRGQEVRQGGRACCLH
ncbi:hypothetical protein J8V57_19940 [Xenorhabdus sp. PB61.4]|uniref:hypothetical protein n=1 Tax=Xenorhabdus sp. PB61.4 TaxID=2788940 RepID=UPI001E65361D|nr:hypothetical protein [Xenorhabdus sp. PB61.4]MCC8368456.1 hypothetical protein [Xenorhabdus sp. PB61.4]